MPFTEKFYTDAEMTQTPPAGTRVIFQGYSNGTASGDKVLRYKDETGEFGTVSGGGGEVTQAILSAKIPTDNNDNHLHITVQLSQRPLFAGYIELSSEQNYSRMMVAQDSEFSGIESDGIYPAFYGGILIILLDKGIEGFDPNLAWYARIRWSNGGVTNPWRLTRFIHTGHINETN